MFIRKKAIGIIKIGILTLNFKGKNICLLNIYENILRFSQYFYIL